MKEYVGIIMMLSFSLFSAYVMGVRKYKISSISQSDYRLKNFKYLFELVMYSSGLAIALFSYATDMLLAQIFLIAGGVLIAGVGIFPDYRKNGFNSIMHSTCAIGGFSLALGALILLLWPIGLLVSVCAIVVHLKTRKDYNHVLTMELMFAYGIFIGFELFYMLNF